MNYKQRVATGLALLARGKAEEADALFRFILEKEPNNSEALHGRACIARAAGRPDLAIGLAGQAIQLDAQPYYYVTLGHALREQGHKTEAEATFRTALLMDPGEARAYNALGLLQEERGAINEAEQSLQRAVVLQSALLDFRVDLARFWIRHGQIGQAINLARDGAQNYPKKAEFLQELAILLHAIGNLEEACKLFKKIVHLCPDNAAAHANLGAVLFNLNQFDQARKHLEIASQKVPESAETQTNLGLVLMAQGFLPEAEKALRQANKLQPQDGRILLNLGTILSEMNQLEEAESLYRTLLRDTDKQLIALEKMDYHRVCYNLGTVLLSKGQYKEGWGYFESRNILLGNLQDQSNLPVWNGEVIKGPLLIRAEQGLGDMIHFLRYLPFLPSQISIIVEVPKSLIRLVQMISTELKASWQIVEKDHIPDGVIAQCALMSLPHLLNLSEIPSFEPYLNCSSINRIKTNDRQGKLQVGLCWAGNPNYKFDQRRSIPKQTLRLLSTIAKVEWYSLQYGIPKTDLPEFIQEPLPEGDLLQTAEIIAGLDLVITVDTVIVHLAGAMGKPVWLLNRYGGDWRWFDSFVDPKTGKNQWYPSLKLFQPSKPLPPMQAWKQTIEKIVTALRLMTHENSEKRLYRDF